VRTFADRPVNPALFDSSTIGLLILLFSIALLILLFSIALLILLFSIALLILLFSIVRQSPC
jgi:hypothetical protein